MAYDRYQKGCVKLGNLLQHVKTYLSAIINNNIVALKIVLALEFNCKLGSDCMKEVSLEAQDQKDEEAIDQWIGCPPRMQEVSGSNTASFGATTHSITGAN